MSSRLANQFIGSLIGVGVHRYGLFQQEKYEPIKYNINQYTLTSKIISDVHISIPCIAGAIIGQYVHIHVLGMIGVFSLIQAMEPTLLKIRIKIKTPEL